MSTFFEKAFYWALVFFFFLLPLQTRYILREAPLYEWGTISVYAVEVLGWVVIVLGLLKYREARPPIRRRPGLLLLILPAWALFSIIWSPDRAVAAQAAVRLLEGILLFFVIAFCTTPNPSSGRRGNETISSPVSLREIPRRGTRGEVRRGGSKWIVYAFLGGAVFQSLLGIYQFLTQSTFASTLLGMALHDPAALGTAVVEFADQRWLRAYGGLPHPNVLGGYLAMALAVVMMLWRSLTPKDSPWRPRTVLWGAIPILITGIFFSFSRAAWGAAIIVMGYWFATEFATRSQRACLKLTIVSFRQKIMRWLAGIGIVVYIIFLLSWFWPLVAVRVDPQTPERLEVRSRVERVEGVREAWALIKKHPVFGVGIGNYTQSVAREVRVDDPLYTYQPVHNVPLLVWAELGTVGLLLLAVALYKIARQSKFYILHFTFLILLLFDHYLWSLPVGILLFWAVLGLSTYNPQDGLDKKTAL